MTFFHFVNCALLTFSPYFIIYHAKLLEYSQLTTILYVSLAYVATQLSKLILLATFVPSSEANVFDFVQEVMKAVIGVADIVGIYVLFRFGSTAPRDVRILALAIGWAGAESVMVRLAPLWINARGLEFSWSHIHIAIDANINIVVYVGFATLVWFFRKEKSQKSYSSQVLSGLVVFSVFPIIMSYFKLEQSFSEWQLSGLNAVFAAVLAFIAWKSYSRYTTTSLTTKKTE